MKIKPPSIFADFNNVDPMGCIRLNCLGTLADIKNLGVNFIEGDKYVFTDGELEAEGIVTWSPEGIWSARITWEKIEE